MTVAITSNHMAASQLVLPQSVLRLDETALHILFVHGFMHDMLILTSMPLEPRRC